MPSEVRRHGFYAAALAAASLCGSGCLGAPEDDFASSAFEATVSGVSGSGCSTSVVLELSRQIADEVRCMAPGTLEMLSEGDGIVFAGSAVLPYLHPSARSDLLDAVSAQGGDLRINSGYRTVVQQYLLYQWYLEGRCGITAAATPGRSNHESGRALDIGNYAEWSGSLPTYRWAQTVPGDWVHFDHVTSPDQRGQDVLAFQRLWNRNHPEDLIDEDGLYGPQTASRIRMSPADGFPIGACPADGYDADLVALDSPDALAPGEVGHVRVEIENTGETTWEPGSTFLGTTAPRDRESDLYDPDSWVSPARATTVAETTEPGEVGVFEFDVLAPELDEGAMLSETFGLVEETVTWFGSEEIEIDLLVGEGDRSRPDEPEGDGAPGNLAGGCAAAGSGGSSAAALLLLILGFVRRRRAPGR